MNDDIGGVEIATFCIFSYDLCVFLFMMCTAEVRIN